MSEKSNPNKPINGFSDFQVIEAQGFKIGVLGFAG